MWKQDIKQLWRTPLRTVAFCLALAVMISLFSMTAGLWYATENIGDTVDEMYTTIGTVPRILPSQYEIEAIANGAYTNDKNLANRLKNNLAQGLMTLKHVEAIHTHSWLMAYDTTVMPLVSEHVSCSMDMPQNIALFAVNCIDGDHFDDGKGQLIGQDNNTYMFEVQSAEILHTNLAVPRFLTITAEGVYAEIKRLFEAGHSYWVWGYYEPNNEAVGALRLYTGVRYGLDNSTAERAVVNTSRWEDERILYMLLPEGGSSVYSIPLIGEYSDDAEQYLREDAVGMWGRLVKMLRQMVHSVRVCSADAPEYLPSFYHGNTHLMDGAFFTEDDIAQGNRVAIVSDLLAQQNDLQIGDSLELSFYRCDWAFTEDTVNENIAAIQPYGICGMSRWDDEEQTQTLTVKPASRNNGTYTVVGIYQTNGWVDDYRALHPNTVIVPQSALYQYYSCGHTDMGVSVVVPNGGIDALEGELTSLGYGEILQYDDGGYGVIMPNVEVIGDSVAFVYRLVSVLWVPVVLALMIFFVWTQIPAGRVKYRLGIDKRAIGKQMTVTAWLMILVSGVVGCLGSILLYDRVLAAMMQANFTTFNVSFSSVTTNADTLEQILCMLGQTPSFFVLAAARQVGVLALLSAILCAVVSMRRIGFKQ